MNIVSLAVQLLIVHPLVVKTCTHRGQNHRKELKAMPLSRLIYYSTITYPIEAGSMDRLTDQVTSSSRENNAQRNITGVLLQGGDFFLQVLEGRRPDLSDTLARIMVDRRHHNVRLVDFRVIEERRFGNWSTYCLQDNDFIEKIIAEQSQSERGPHSILGTEELVTIIHFLAVHDDSAALNFG
ncbi:MAG: BLUF domain-containing protein [Pseudomonadota bacterium]